MKIILIICSLFISSYVLSQKKEIEFGKISHEEMDMKSYEKDPDAKAVVLYDKGKSIFFDSEGGYDIRFTRHKRIKIFDKSAAEYAEISIPYYVDGFGKTEVIKSVEAITYNGKDGRIFQKKLDPSTIYEERLSEKVFQKKFVFPDVQDGSILELQYTLETPFHFNLPDWVFQDKIPTVYSEYEVSMIPFYEYVFLVQGITSFDHQNSVVGSVDRTWGNVSKSYGKTTGSGVEFKDYIHTYALKDIPAFKDESYITSINDYLIKMDFQLAKFYSPYGGTSEVISTWPKLNESLLKHENFGKYIKSSARPAKQIIEEDLELVGLDENMKAKTIIEYVKNNFEWNDYSGKYASQSPKDFVDKKSGNDADINLFMIALLNAADIDAQPLILSTRGHGKIPSDYPFDHFTNYVIALVNTSTPFLADGTEELLSFNKLPIRCFNEKGLVVNDQDQPTWVGLKNNMQSLEKYVIALTLDTITSDVQATVLTQSTEYDSFLARKRFKDDTLKIKGYYSDKIGEINRIKTYGYPSIHSAYSISFSADYETEKLGNNVVIKPFFNLPPNTNDLTQKERTYPVEFLYPWEVQFESTLKLPEGYSLSELPEAFEWDNDLVDVSLTYALSNNILVAKGNYKFKKSIYVAKEYARIKYSFDQIVKYFNQPIVLEVKE